MPCPRHFLMINPIQCRYWNEPEALNGGYWDAFERLRHIVDERHLDRMELRCKECGQHYFYEFTEEVNFGDGGDPHIISLIPVRSEGDMQTLLQTSALGFRTVYPRLQLSNTDGKSPHEWVWLLAPRDTK